MTASVTAAGTTPQATWTSNLSWRIANPYENTPPNPKPTDRMPTDWALVSPPSRSSMPTASWNIWDYVSGAFKQTTYHAGLNASLAIAPAPKTPTAFSSGGQWTMKSGYGLTEKENAAWSSDEADAITSVQSVTSYYPEFEYQTYNRNLQQTSAGVFELAPNIYSLFKSRVHFTPVDFPDGTYTVQSYAYNTWSPAGMLSNYSTDSINIQDDAFND